MRTPKIIIVNTFLAIIMMMAVLLCWTSQAQAAQDGDYTYTVTNGTAQITGYTGVGGHITIPSRLGGATVTSIGKMAFYGRTSLTGITIQYGVNNIGDSAFESCTNLISVSLPESLTSIDYWAFQGCSSLSSINLPSSLISIGQTAFGDCTKLTSITLPSSLISINQEAFGNCTKLTSITIPSNVTSIGFYAFGNCSNMTSITFNSATTAIYNYVSTIPAQATIIGYNPSTAKDYATKYNRTFKVLSINASYISVIAISLSPSSLTFDDKTPQTIATNISPANATYKNIIWTTSDPNVATVSNGVVTPLSVGTAIITARPAYGSGMAQCTVEVNSMVTEGPETDVLREIAMSTFVEKVDANKLNANAFQGKLVTSVPVNGTMFTSSGGTQVMWDEFFDRYLDNYTIKDSQGYGSGMQAMTFQDPNGNIVIAYSGTRTTDYMDYLNDLLMGLNIQAPQFSNALDYYKKILGLYGQGKKITLVGHSLGGALASYVSIMEGGIKADGFNDATGHMLLSTYRDNPLNIPVFSGVDTTAYTSYINIDWDPFQPLGIAFNNFVTEDIATRNHFRFTSNGYTPTSNYWEHELAAIINYDDSNGSFSLTNDKLSPEYLAGETTPGNKTTIKPVTIEDLILGTSGADIIDFTKSSSGHMIYTGNGGDQVLGGSGNDTIVAIGSGIKFLNGGDGNDLYILDMNNIQSVTICDPAGRDVVYIKNVNINDLSIKEDPNYYNIYYNNNEYIKIGKAREGCQPSIELRDQSGNEIYLGGFNIWDI